MTETKRNPFAGTGTLRGRIEFVLRTANEVDEIDGGPGIPHPVVVAESSKLTRWFLGLVRREIAAALEEAASLPVDDHERCRRMREHADRLRKASR